MKPSKFTAAAPAPHPSLKPKPGDEIMKALSLNPKPLNPKPAKPLNLNPKPLKDSDLLSHQAYPSQKARTPAVLNLIDPIEPMQNPEQALNPKPKSLKLNKAGVPKESPQLRSIL